MRPHLFLLFLNLIIFNFCCAQEESKVGTYSVIAYLHSAMKMGAGRVVFERANGEKVLKCLREFDEIDNDITSIVVEIPGKKKIKTFTFVRDGNDWLRISVDRETKRCTIL
ncbi:MAG TPA: hypothetical protein VHO47_02970 [Candidatus Babeliales bacterium]|nr:hypothetical protein [Candidatus Babeliales bacterium]